jgi:GrpB-like predicted nucleotidyltransferase (UPF0157 family)
MARKVDVVGYDRAWPAAFASEAEQIRGVLGSNRIAIHHMGSTAVPGLAAKPTIDLLIEVESLAVLDACNPTMLSLGYQAKGEHGIPGRRYFQRLEGDVHLFHVHAFKMGHPDILRHLNFRDYLRAHPDEARAYQALKLRLAAQFRYEPRCYTSGKTAFILAIDQRAALWCENDVGSRNSR